MFGKKREGPKVYVTRTGGFYVKADELLRSEKGQQRIREAAELMARLRARAKAKQENPNRNDP